MCPVLIQMAGHGGSGKSTLARKIAEDVHGIVIDLDTIKTSLLDSGARWHEASAWSDPISYALVDDSLDVDGSWVIVDTPSYWPEIHEQLTRAAAAHGANHAFIECRATNPPDQIDSPDGRPVAARCEITMHRQLTHRMT